MRILQLLALLLLAGPLCAANDPKAEAALKRCIDFVATQPTVAVDITATFRLDDPPMDEINTISVAAKRPNLFSRQTSKDGVVAESVVSDGEKAWRYVGELDAYEEFAPGADFDTLLRGDTIGEITFFNWLLRKDGLASVTQDIEELALGPESDLDGTPAVVVEQRNADSTARIWIRSGDQPVPLRVEIARKAEKRSITLAFGNWRLGDTIPAARFAFAPPAKAKKVKALREELVKAFQQAQAEDLPLLGLPAPDFTLNTPDGRAISLASHRGKDVVILDFWASWCGPCRKGLPVVSEAAAEFGARNVVFYAVNLQEPKEKIAAFLEKERLSPTVLMDDGAVAKSFGVKGIPHTVVVGKDGKVAAVHVGFSADLAVQLRAELEAATK